MDDRASNGQTGYSNRQSPLEEPGKRQAAETAVKALVDAFLDRRVSSGFLDKLIEVIETYPPAIIARLACPRTGLPKHFDAMPSLKAVTAFADKLIGEDNDRARFAWRDEVPLQRRDVLPDAPREKFRPFPKLWEAFAREPAVLDVLESGLVFQRIEAASRALATQGPSAARLVLGIEP